MISIWKAIAARIVLFFTPAPKEILKPGECECGHMRCSHVKGKGHCKADWPPDEEADRWMPCACEIYIRDDDSDDDDDPETPTPSELERMYQK